jgi:hypothetical protein
MASGERSGRDSRSFPRTTSEYGKRHTSAPHSELMKVVRLSPRVHSTSFCTAPESAEMQGKRWEMHGE